MYYEFDDDFKEKNSEEDCKKMLNKNIREMKKCDKKIEKLRDVLDTLDEYELTTDIKEIQDEVYYLEETADSYERRAIFWDLALKKFYKN